MPEAQARLSRLLLLAMLRDYRHRFRTLESLSRAIGQDPAVTKTMLQLLPGVRHAHNNENLWGLRQRVDNTDGCGLEEELLDTLEKIPVDSLI